MSRLKIGSGVIAVLAVVTGLAWTLNGRADVQRRPDVVVEGRVTEAVTGRPIPDAFVIVNLRTFRAARATHHGASSCVRGSGVVRTDADGRYRFARKFDDPNERYLEDLSVDLRVYRPEMTYYPDEGWTWFPISKRTSFELARDTASFEKRMNRLRLLLDNTCNYSTEQSYAPLFEAMFGETWSAYCGPQSAGYSFVVYEIAKDHLLGMIGLRDELASPSKNESDRVDRGISLMKRTRALLPTYPWPPYNNGSPPNPVPRDLSREEKRTMCEFFAQHLADARGQ